MFVSLISKLLSVNEFCHSVATFKVIKSTSKCHPGGMKKHVAEYSGLQNETVEFI
jgi:hypothetical protein